jgi:hypothetical protein
LPLALERAKNFVDMRCEAGVKGDQ